MHKVKFIDINSVRDINGDEYTELLIETQNQSFVFVMYDEVFDSFLGIIKHNFKLLENK
jgi:hypothetical protein